MVSGWRGYCPIRKMRGNPANQITEAHVHAADMLREAADLAWLGYSGERPMLYVAMTAQPRAGMSKADMARNKALRDLGRAIRIFTREQRELIASVILRNESLNSWCRRKTEETGARYDPLAEKHRLLLILDMLAAHFDSEIEDDQRNGRRLAS